MVIPVAAGGPLDALGRILAPRLGEILGQQVVVENVTGAGGMIGANRVAKSADSHTFLLGHTGTIAYNQTLYKRPAYNSNTEFAPVSLTTEGSYVLITRKDLPPNNLAEFVAYAKANQGKLQYGPVVPVRTAISPASCSTWRSERASRTFPIAAPGRRCRT
jgi:tripartite-type tricarboxylate transporter receptor subunit TctC